MSSKDHIVKSINKVLSNNWTASDVQEGKNIKCMRSWNLHLKEVVSMYEKKGWVVKKQIALSSLGRQLLLNFKNPHWQNN